MDSDSENDVIIKPEPLASSRKANMSRAKQAQQAQVASASEEEDEEEVVNPKGKKRARTGDKPPADEDEEGDAELNAKELIRDSKGYVSGSIVRVLLENFVTYDHVEFTPGPDLNMILGPNGTGKSTIACAIAIGLGFPAKVLGRSKNVREYVKIGTESGWVEIELKGLPGKRNLVIRRNLNKDNDTTSFTLDRKSATAGDVAAKMAELNVQVGNLCTFLPQDRVASFAKLSPAELLEETQKAAGDQRLSQWHKTLIEERVNQKEFESEVERGAAKLKKEEDKQMQNEKEVKQFEARQKIENEIAVLELLLPFAQYEVARNADIAAKERRNQLKNELAELEAANKPFQDSLETLGGIVKHYEVLGRDTREQTARINKDLGKKQKELEKSEADVVKTRENLDAIKKDEKQRRLVIASLQKEVAKLQAVVDNKPEAPDLEDVERRYRKKVAERPEATQRLADNKEIANTYEREQGSLTKNKGRIHQQLQGYRNVQMQRERECAKWDKPTMDAVHWLRNNLDKFKGKVYEPVRLSVTAKDKKFVNLAEGPIHAGAMRSFVFERQEDYDFMMRELNDGPKSLRINGANLAPGKTLADYPRKFSPEKLAEWGFDCHAIDLIDGPPQVLAWLCETIRLHEMPIQTVARQLHTREIEASHQVKRYYTLDGSHSIKWSSYGNKGSQVEQRSLPNAKILSQGEDTQRIGELQRESEEIEAQLQALKHKWNAVTKLDHQLHDQIKAIDEAKKALGEEKQRLMKPMRDWNSANVKLDSKQHSLRVENGKPTGEAKRAKLRTIMATLTEKRVRYSLEYKNLVFKSSKLQISAIATQLRLVQAESDLRAMATSVTEKDVELAEKRAEHTESAAKFAQLRTIATDLGKLATQQWADADDDLQARAQPRKNVDGLADLEAELAQKETDLSCTLQISPAVLQKYEQRKIEIADQTARLEANRNKLNTSTAQINKIEALWLPRLEDLLNKINQKFTAAFDRMKRLGEIRLKKDPDYAKWGIEILVSFRDTEALQVLTAHRQSGGERALTTVMYLMSLAEVGKAPFALVDEINQGMDRSVERQVHNALVKTTCKDDVGQYFLITPKLLPNLEYHNRMKVLIINNGDWLPQKLSLQELVNNRVAKNEAGRGRALPTP